MLHLFLRHLRHDFSKRASRLAALIFNLQLAAFATPLLGVLLFFCSRKPVSFRLNQLGFASCYRYKLQRYAKGARYAPADSKPEKV